MMMMMMSWCLMSSDVIWHIRDKLWPMPKHGSIKSTYIRCMRVLAVTCHLHFWQNDRDFLCATVVTRGWNGYRNKSQHRKSTLEKKILPPFQQGFEPATFQSRVRCSNHWAIPAPHIFRCLHSVFYTGHRQWQHALCPCPKWGQQWKDWKQNKALLTQAAPMAGASGARTAATMAAIRKRTTNTM